MTRVSVVIPIGPHRPACGFLPEAIASLEAQTRRVDELVIVDDMHGIHTHAECVIEAPFTPVFPSWRLGVPGAFNAGVAEASGDLIVMLGADDWLEPEAIERLVDRFERGGKKIGYYHFTIRYSDTGELQTLPNNCAAVTPALWRETGGFPPESAIGACDTMLISILLKHHPGWLHPVADGVPLYNYRRHQTTDTGTRPIEYQGPIHVVRDILTRTWSRPAWGRM